MDEKEANDMEAEPYVAWAKNLAINMGAYSLASIIDLDWPASADADVTGS
jgi:hypothetical protein